MIQGQNAMLHVDGKQVSVDSWNVPAVRAVEQRLIAAIMAAPEAPEPRLMYADWLEEQGHVHTPRIIRVMVEAEHALLLMSVQPYRFKESVHYGVVVLNEKERESFETIPAEAYAPGDVFSLLNPRLIEGSPISVEFYHTTEHAKADYRQAFLTAYLNGWRP